MAVVNYKQNFTKADIDNFIRKKLAVIDEVVRDQLFDVAEQFVADARSLNTYTDRTRNLRGSIGYSLEKNGTVIAGSFDGTAEGQAQARHLISKIRGQFPSGYVLYVVAGMNYAIYVEAKGYDVISGPALVAEASLRRQFRRLQEALRRLK